MRVEFFGSCLPETNSLKPTCKWGGRKWSSSEIINFQGQCVGFREGIQNQENPTNQTQKNYGIRFQSPHWSSLCFCKTKNLNDVGRQRIAIATFDAAIIALPVLEDLSGFRHRKTTFQPLCFQMDQQSRLSRDGFVVQIGCVLWSDFFFHQNTGSPSTQLPLVVIVGESYPIVGEWVGIVGDPPTGPFHLLPIDWMYRYKYSTWTWTWTLTLTYMYIHI